MTTNFIRKGDKTTTGGVVLEGSSGMSILGSGSTTVGMIASCPVCKIGKGAIVAVQTSNIIINGAQSALDGDIVSCGCPYGSNKVIASNNAVSLSFDAPTMTPNNSATSITQKINAMYGDVAKTF
ncbi:hypothetical protein PCNPT3_08345 [Psychromonas sp. CNPT3]|uniref:PAAR domain-containing protein n=1 Tax=Psychromonas sp. CNPT3 TaxID=314282 RepID=UPI00006E85DC|nr:PAAR domain-containing protein [Psychromonas sp. CNPT3]AGH81607.1 hypothetical protein PCNPT3_08345 [Psychromonas sp. CNPT3]